MEPTSSLNDNKIIRLVSSLSGSGASSRALDVIAVLRRDVLTKSDGVRQLREAGGLDRLVSLLRRGSERIQNSTLSALATCCLEDESCTMVGKLNISILLVSIVKTSAQDSVLGRACRLLGNLAQNQNNAESLHAAGAVPALIGLLERRDNNTSYPTLTMLVRAIRLLWMIADKREEMLSLGVVRAIAVLLTTECETLGIIKPSSPSAEPREIRNSQEELLNGLLKCLGHFTTLSSVQCAEQLQGEGRGYQCLVALTRTHETVALQCLMNLCYVPSCRPALGVAGVVECLVGVLSKLSDVSWWPEGASRALAQLSEESVNRSRLRHCGGLPLLLAAARTSHHALQALLQYVFDDSAFQILVDEGLLTFLTEELAAHLTTMPYEHEISDDSERECQQENVADDKVEEESVTHVKKKGLILSKDELNVVIERDNMIVGFVDNDTDAEEAADDEPRRNKKNKLAIKCQLSRMARQDWSSSVYWEVKSPELCSSRSPDGCSRYAEPGWPEGDRSGKRARLDWSPDTGLESFECTSSDGCYSLPSTPDSRYCTWSYSPVESDSETDLEEPEAEPPAEPPEPPAEPPEPPTERPEPPDEPLPDEDLSTTNMLHELDDLMMDDDACDPTQLDDSKADSVTRASRVGCVLVLWLCLSRGAGPERAGGAGGARGEAGAREAAVRLLTRTDSLRALADYLERCRRPYGRAAKILARILSNSLCLMSVLHSGLAMRLHKMAVSPRHPQDKCRQCRQLVRICKMMSLQVSRLADSEYGIGEICYKLYKGPASVKNDLCLTLPYFVRTPKALLHYFVKCSGLDTLIELIEETNESIADHVTALARLATNFKIRNPKTVENNFKDHRRASYELCLDACSDLVTFELDDSSTVDANKKFLCENSEVFSAMLTGQFKESAERCVRLKEATKPGLEYMLALLQCGFNRTQSDVMTFPLAERLETSLEALVLADRFLLKRMRTQLRSAVVQFQLSAANVQDIYIWSQNEGMLELWTEAVCYVLVGEMTDSDRVNAFSSVLELQYRQQWLKDVKSLILQHASPEFRSAFTET